MRDDVLAELTPPFSSSRLLFSLLAAFFPFSLSSYKPHPFARVYRYEAEHDFLLRQYVNLF